MKKETEETTERTSKNKLWFQGQKKKTPSILKKLQGHQTSIISVVIVGISCHSSCASPAVSVSAFTSPRPGSVPWADSTLDLVIFSFSWHKNLIKQCSKLELVALYPQFRMYQKIMAARKKKQLRFFSLHKPISTSSNFFRVFKSNNKGSSTFKTKLLSCLSYQSLEGDHCILAGKCIAGHIAETNSFSSNSKLNCIYIYICCTVHQTIQYIYNISYHIILYRIVLHRITLY